MGRRRVTVDLDLQARGYIGTARQVALTTRSTEHAIDELGDAADATGRDLQGMAATTALAAGRVDDLGEQATQAAVGLRVLDQQIDRVRRSEVALAATQVATGAARSMGGGNRGGWGGTGIDFSRGFTEARGMAIFSAVGIGAVAAPVLVPMLGAAVAGAVVGAAGVGGIAGGIVAAAGDPQVKSAWQNFVGSLTAEDFGREAFVAPTVDAIAELRDAVHDMNIGDALKPLAALVPVLAKGVGDFGRNFMPGFSSAMAKAGPLLRMFSRELGETGDALGDMLDTMATDPGTVAGLQAIMDGLQGLIRWTGGATNAMGQWWRGMTDVGEKVTGWQQKYLGWADPFIPGVNIGDWHKHWQEWEIAANGAADATANVNNEMSAFGRYLQDAAEHTGDLTVRLDELFRGQMDAAKSTIYMEQTMDDLAESVKENGRSMDIRTEKGRANVSALLAEVDAAQRVRDANLNLGQSAETVDAQYMRQLETIRAHAYALGLDKKAVDALVGKYEVDITYQVRFLVQKGFGGYQGAPSVAQLEAATRTLPVGPRFDAPGPSAPSRMSGSDYSDAYGTGGGRAHPTPYGYPVGADPRLYGHETGPGSRTLYPGEFQGRQHGGPVLPYRAYRVGERGEEILYMGNRSGYVAPSQPSPGWGGGTMYHVVRLEWPDGRLIREFAITDATSRGVSQSTIEAAYP